MIKFWHISFDPKAWRSDDPRLTDWERMSKCGTVVAKAYSEALRTGEPVPARTSWGKFNLSPRLEEFVRGTFAMSDGLGELHGVPCPPTADVLALPDFERRALLLDVLYTSAVALAEDRGWPTAPFEAARQAVLDAGLRFRLESAPKSAPDRKHKARLEFEIDGRGDGWLQLIVTTRDGTEIRRSPALYTDTSIRHWNACRRTLRWSDSAHVSVDHWPLDEPFGPTDHVFELDLSAGAG